jgi:hypothetical protein
MPPECYRIITARGIDTTQRGIRGCPRIKSPAQTAGVDDLLGRIKPELLAILLDTGRAETGEAVLIDRVLPGEEFLDRQGVAAAGFFQ